MKRLIGCILALFAMATMSQAATLVYSGVMVSTNGPASSAAAASTTTWTMDLNQNGGLQTIGAGGDIIGAQLNYAQSTLGNVTFTDGSESTVTVTLANYQALSPAKATNTITVSTNSALNPAAASALVNVALNTTGALNGSTLTIAVYNNINTTYTIVGGVDYSVGASSNATAIAIAAAVNLKVNGVVATVTPVGGSSVTITSDQLGTIGNTYTVASSTPAALNIAGVSESANQAVNFTGGLDAASIYFYNGVSNLTFTNGQTWKSDPVFSSNTAVAIKSWFNAVDYGVTAATTSANVVTLTAERNGTYANGFLLSTSTGALTVGSASFTGGQNAGTLAINGVYLTAGIDFAVTTSSNITASNLAAAINSNPSLNTLVVASTQPCPFCGIVWATGTTPTAGYATFSSTQSAMTLSPFTSSSTVTGIATGTMFGGSTPNYAVNSTVINVANHGFTPGYAVWYSTGSNILLSPLAFNTTYYVGVIDANNFGLATSQANALAGSFITFTSSRTNAGVTTGTVHKLNATTLTGTPLFQIQGSNDGSSFQNITAGENGSSISILSFPSPYTSGSANWAIGTFPWRYLRLLYSAPTTGGTKFSFYLNQKTSSSAR